MENSKLNFMNIIFGIMHAKLAKMLIYYYTWLQKLLVEGHEFSQRTIKIQVASKSVSSLSLMNVLIGFSSVEKVEYRLLISAKCREPLKDKEFDSQNGAIIRREIGNAVGVREK